MLSEQPQSVDFEHYRSILNNKAVVDEIERQVKPYKPATYDVGRQIKAIEAFEATAVKSAEETKAVVDRELADLNRTLRNIEEARPIDQLTMVCYSMFQGARCLVFSFFTFLLFGSFYAFEARTSRLIMCYLVGSCICILLGAYTKTGNAKFADMLCCFTG